LLNWLEKAAKPIGSKAQAFDGLFVCLFVCLFGWLEVRLVRSHQQTERRESPKANMKKFALSVAFLAAGVSIGEPESL
jgi:hypothetical protein